jgi:hypothetical protein
MQSFSSPEETQQKDREIDSVRQNKVSVAEYLYFLSVKYKVGFDNIVKGLVLAQEDSEVSCGNLLIQCRQKTGEYYVFLITNGCQVVAQFPVPKYFLDQPNQIMEPKYGHFFRKIAIREFHENPRCIRDLRCGMKRINLRARVLDLSKATLVFTRFGEQARVSNVLIADETGTIKLCLWNERINSVSVDSVIEIKNASVAKFRGENQLRLGRNGTLSMVENADFPSLSEIEKGFLKSSAV